MGILFAVLLLIQAPAPQTRLASVLVKGNQRDTLADIEKLSGLDIGKPTGPSDLEAAASKLWKKRRPIPVTFDNFVWISDEQLKA